MDLKDEGGKAALCEVFGLQRDRKDFTAAMATLERILNAGPDPDNALEANYRRGEILLLLDSEDEEVETWEAMAAMEPKLAQGVNTLLTSYDAGQQDALSSAARDLEKAARAHAGEVYPTAQVLDLELLYNNLRPFRTPCQFYVAALVLLGF